MLGNPKLFILESNALYVHVLCSLLSDVTSRAKDEQEIISNQVNYDLYTLQFDNMPLLHKLISYLLHNIVYRSSSGNLSIIQF